MVSVSTLLTSQRRADETWPSGILIWITLFAQMILIKYIWFFFTQNNSLLAHFSFKHSEICFMHPQHLRTFIVQPQQNKHDLFNIAFVQRLNQHLSHTVPKKKQKNIWNPRLACKCNVWGSAFTRVSAAIKSLALAWWSVNSLDLQINNPVHPSSTAWQWNISICV